MQSPASQHDQVRRIGGLSQLGRDHTRNEMVNKGNLYGLTCLLRLRQELPPA
jgi:hypothetical protein